MQNTASRFITNIVPLQNVQTNVSGEGVQQSILSNITSLRAAVASLQAAVASLQARITVLEGKVG
jgi:hypothetical protein